MSEHQAKVTWQRDASESFTDGRYSRRHVMHFDGGAEVAGSASPTVVPLPLSDAGAVDPEEMFVASLSGCHMLWFLSIAAKHGFRVDRYTDNASGTLARASTGRMAITRVMLRPQCAFSGERMPTQAELDELHEAAHRACFIANSVNCELSCTAELLVAPN
jgi:organic hydroperoxide reductase OsmC/OhrA